MSEPWPSAKQTRGRAPTSADRAGAPPTRRPAPPQGAGKSLTIGAVCKALVAGVPGHLDLEDPLPRGPEAARAAAHAGRLPAVLGQRRLAPAHDPAPAARRVPAAARDPPGARRGARASPRSRSRRRRRRRRARRAPGRGAAAADVLDRAARRAVLARGRRRGDGRRAAADRRARGLRDRQGRRCAAARSYYDETEREIVRAVSELARYGVAGRNLRVFKTSAERESALLQQILAPAPALAQSRAPQGGRRGAREPRRRRVAPQAPAARARPAADRAVSGRPTSGR